MSLFGCANDEQFLDELKLPPVEFEWNPGKEFNIGPEWPSWAHGDIKSISIQDLRQVCNGRECKSYKEYLEELESHDKQRRKHFSLL